MKNVQEWAILDSGATSHFLVFAAPMTNVRPAKVPLTVKLSDGAHIQSTATCTLAMPDLPAKAREAHTIPGLSHHSLLSVVTLCNTRCDVKFTKIGCYVKYQGTIVMTGAKCTKTGLWMVPLSPPILQSPMGMQKITYEPVKLNGKPIKALQERAYSIVETSTMAELAMNHHQTLCSSPKSTLLRAIKISN